MIKKKFKKIETHEIIDELLSYNLLNLKGKKGHISVIDPFELVKNIKQLMMLINILKYKKKQKVKVNILVSHKFLKTCIQQYLIKSKMNKFINVSNNVLEIKNEKIVIFCGGFGMKELDYLINRLFNQNKYLFNLVSIKEDIYNRRDGSYPIYNEGTEIKKIFYLVTIINKLLAK